MQDWMIMGEGPHVLLLAHGAGAPMDSDFMSGLAGALAGEGIRTVRFEFPYMQRRRTEGKRPPPSREPALLQSWTDQVERVLQSELTRHGQSLFVGGKSLGGRMASLWCSRRNDVGSGPVGCLCFGYPFHPPGKPDNWRDQHFQAIRVPLWIAQGERDPFGRYSEIMARQYTDIDLTRIPVDDGDHDFKPRKRSGIDPADNFRQVARQARLFMDRAVAGQPRASV